MRTFTHTLLPWAFFLGSFTVLLWLNLPVSIPVSLPIGENGISFEIEKPQISIAGFERDMDIKLGLDLQGGSSLTFEADISELEEQDIEPALESARNIIEQRVNLYGLAEPSIRTIETGNSYRILVNLPGIEDTSEAVALIGSTAQLSFREEEIATNEAQFATPSAFQNNFTIETGLTGQDVERAQVVFDPNNGTPQVQLNFTNEGAQLFADITARNVGRQVAIILDDTVISAPVVQQQIPDRQAVISGQFTVDQAQQLSIAINSGALPIPIQLVEQTTVGPSLGALEVEKSLIAGTVGLLIVMVFMVAYYGRLGVIACIALLFYGLISLLIFRLIPIVLTLPGVAGFILSIGMAVDANILIFERIKEEQRKGQSFQVAFATGFKRAMSAIKDANITTLLITFILFNPLSWNFLPQFGLVRGFALTLAIGVLISLFSGVFITKRLIRLFS